MEDIINKRFDENRTRQGLLTLEEDSKDISDDKEDDLHPPNPSTPSSSLTTTMEDKSRKGSVDTRIRPLVTLINSTEDFFTTSTCSGRIILFTNEYVSAARKDETLCLPTKIKKKGCKWLMVTHEEVKVSELLDAWEKACKAQGDFEFKFEPAILHIQCRRLSDAKKLIHAATESAFRNSGMVIGGKENRITVAIRSTLGIEVPLTTTDTDEIPIITKKYIEFLVQKANEKMIENWRRLEKFTEEFRKAFKQ